MAEFAGVNKTVSLRGSHPGFAKQARPGVNLYFETALLGTLPKRLPREQMRRCIWQNTVVESRIDIAIYQVMIQSD